MEMMTSPKSHADKEPLNTAADNDYVKFPEQEVVKESWKSQTDKEPLNTAAENDYVSFPEQEVVKESWCKLIPW